MLSIFMSKTKQNNLLTKGHSGNTEGEHQEFCRKYYKKMFSGAPAAEFPQRGLPAAAAMRGHHRNALVILR